MQYSEVLERVDQLARLNFDEQGEKTRIRAICDGGPEGIAAIMAWEKGRQERKRKAEPLGHDLPAVNMIASGIDRVAQKVGRAPALKLPHGPQDKDDLRVAAEKRERMVESWDHQSILELQFPQVGRWLPGYGSFSWVIRSKLDPVTRQTFPHAELRDPYDTWTGWLGPTQHPDDIAYRRIVPISALERIYPRDDWGIISDRVGQKTDSVMYGTPRDRGWEGKASGVCVLEYFCGDGTYVCVPEAEVVLDYYPNILDTGIPVVYGKRPSFNRLRSQYHHVIGLSAMMAKLNVLALIASEDATLKELNIFGELEGNTYRRGRKQQNFLAANARVERGPMSENIAQLFGQIDRVEDQLRIGAAYDKGSDSLAARGGFITGRGQEALRDPIDANIDEYHRVIRVATEQLDTKRLEWEEKYGGNQRKRVFWIEGGVGVEETYNPSKDIAGMWRSKRLYGMMATWDDASKIVSGLQLLQGEVIDVEEFQANLDGLDELVTLNRRIRKKKAEKTLMFALEQQAVNGDQRATMALVEIRKSPEDMETILDKYFTPSEPEPSPEEQAMMAAQGMGPGGLEEPPGAIPQVQTILSRLTGGGEAEGGVQTVGTNVA